MSDEQFVYSQEIPDNKLQARIFTNFSFEDVIFFVVCVGLGYLTAITIPIGVVFVAVVTVVLFIRFPSGVGRLYREVWLELVGMYIEGTLGGILWQADESGREKRFAKYLRGRKSAIPIELTQIKAVINGKLERFGLLQQLDRPYDHMYIIASGGNFANTGNASESRNVNLLASVTNASILQNTDMKVGLSYLRITTPSDPYKLSGTLRRKIDPIIRSPKDFKLSDDDKAYVDWQRQNIDQWQPVITSMGGTKDWQLIVITIKRSWATRLRSRTAQSRKKRANNQQLINLPIIELGRTLVHDLSNAPSLGLKDVHVLGFAELTEIVRVSWDAFGANKYFQAKSVGQAPSTDDDIDRFMELHKDNKDLPKLLDGFLQPLPKRIVRIHRKKKCVQFDENYISVIRITRLPERIRPDQFRELQYRLSSYGWIRRAMVAESVSSDKETRQALIGQSALINLEQALNSKKIVQDPRIAVRRRKKQAQTNIISAQSIAQLFNNLWPVVCNDLNSVPMAHQQILGILRGAGFRAKVVSQSALYVDAAISGLFGANRL